MEAYWWECEACGVKAGFPEVTGVRNLVKFFRDRLIPSKWDQVNLASKCKHCGAKMRITYEFPSKNKEVVRVVCVVGFVRGEYVHMMWETYPLSSPDDRWFDFKYIRGNSPYGLNKAAVLSRKDLRELFALYCAKSGELKFP